jgi:hypothetical protein
VRISVSSGRPASASINSALVIFSGTHPCKKNPAAGKQRGESCLSCPDNNRHGLRTVSSNERFGFDETENIAKDMFTYIQVVRHPNTRISAGKVDGISSGLNSRGNHSFLSLNISHSQSKTVRTGGERNLSRSAIP